MQKENESEFAFREGELQQALRKAGDDFLRLLREEVDSCVFLRDCARLHGLVSAVHSYLDHRLIQSLRDKGLDRDLRRLCVKAGKVKETVKNGRREASPEC